MGESAESIAQNWRALLTVAGWASRFSLGFGHRRRGLAGLLNKRPGNLWAGDSG